MYATKKQETVNVSKVSPDQIVVNAPLVFITTPSVLGVHAVLLVPLKMLVSLIIFVKNITFSYVKQFFKTPF